MGSGGPSIQWTRDLLAIFLSGRNSMPFDWRAVGLKMEIRWLSGGALIGPSGYKTPQHEPLGWCSHTVKVLS